MKRSDAINLILKQFNIPHDMTTPDFPRLLANSILESLEKAGMLPPRTKIKGTGFEDNYWEPEDMLP